jgi:hypothetical protein
MLEDCFKYYNGC